MHRESDPDRAAVTYILTTPLIAGRTAPYLAGDDPDFEGLAAEAGTMSSGQALLVQIASDLWTAEQNVSVVDLVRRLDARHFLRVVDALRLARGGPIWDVVETMAYSGPEELAA